MTPKKKTPVEELSDQLVEIKVLEKPSKSRGFDSAKFKKLAQKVRNAVEGEDLLRLEASI